MNANIVIFTAKVFQSIPMIETPLDVTLEKIECSPEHEVDEAAIEKRVAEWLFGRYAQVLDATGHRVPTKQVVETVMGVARDESSVFWKVLDREVDDGPEMLEALKDLKSLKDIEVLLRSNRGWNF